VRIQRAQARFRNTSRSNIGIVFSGEEPPVIAVSSVELSVIPTLFPHVSLSTNRRRRATSRSPRAVTRIVVSIALIVVERSASARKVSATPPTPNATATVC
jgi:hypothetical protein